MTNEQQTEPTLEIPISLRLQYAVQTWYAARHRCTIEPDKQNRDAYCKATDELGQTFSRWQLEQPELFEQFMFARPDD